jgi:[histone H3]-lysine4/36 N-trimethyltransferase SMYD
MRPLSRRLLLYVGVCLHQYCMGCSLMPYGATGSRACQQRDWKPDHVAECSTLAQLTALKLRSDQLSDVLLLGRVVRRVTAAMPNAGDALSATVSPLRLAWYEDDCTQEIELLAVLTQKLGLVRGEATATSLQHLQRLLSRFRNNNFSICDARLVPVGAGCFPLAAMVNHSCEPNAAITCVESSRLSFICLSLSLMY